MKKLKETVFEKGSEFDVLANAIIDASGSNTFMDDTVYDFLEKQPRSSLVVHLVDSINDLGYKIVKKS